MLVPTKPQTREIHCAPKHHPCPRCGVKGVRDRLCVRLVRSLAFGREAWLHIHYAEYKARCGCCKTFRSCPSDVMPKGDYDDRVRRTVVDRLIEDDLNVERTRLSMKREFLLDLSVGFIYDCLDWALRQLNLSEARNEAIAFFSGTLCIDELHLGKRIALVATDPLSNRIVAFALISVNDQAHMRRFLLMLKHWGLRPALVVSDGSTLYPALLREILPWAAHQLCIFHVIQDINKKVLDALRRLRNCQSRKGNSGRKRKRGGRSKAAKKQRERRGPTLKEKSAFVFKHRFLIVKRAEKLNEKEKQALAQMIEYLPELRVLTQFAQEVYKLWQTDQSQKVAKWRWSRLKNKQEYQEVPELNKVLEWMTPEKFKKTQAFFHQPPKERIKTNNHVERVNRKLRFDEKVRYKFRSSKSIVRFFLLRIDRCNAHARREIVDSVPSDTPD